MMTKYRVTVRATKAPHKGRDFTYVLETKTRDEAIALAKQYAQDFDRITSTVLHKIEEVPHVAA